MTRRDLHDGLAGVAFFMAARFTPPTKEWWVIVNMDGFIHIGQGPSDIGPGMGTFRMEGLSPTQARKAVLACVLAGHRFCNSCDTETKFERLRRSVREWETHSR